MIIYLQVAQISQALIFITRSHGWFFMERPSFALLGAFCLAQLISSIIAAYGDWGFSAVQGISGGWIGICWVWNVRPSFSAFRRARELTIAQIIWFFPLDVRSLECAVTRSKLTRAQLIKFGMRYLIARYIAYRKSKKPAVVPTDESGVPLTKTKSRAASIHESLYQNRTTFLGRAASNLGLKKRVNVNANGACATLTPERLC